MAVPDSLILASEVIGFLSFAFTLLTVLGVYVDLLRTLQGAPTTIPIALGNLREEIRYEQRLCKQQGEGEDPFHVLPGGISKAKGRQDFNRLFGSTLRLLWTQFCDIEKRFLVEGGGADESNVRALDSDDDGGKEYDEKSASGRRRRRRRSGRAGQAVSRPLQPHRESFIKGRMGWIEAGLSRDRHTYYNTDISHRFLWWFKKDDVKDLADQVQRIQLRRVEKDTYETNNLVKRALRMYGQRSGLDVYNSSDSNSDRDGGGGGGGRGPGSDNGGGGGSGRRNGSGTNHNQSRRYSGIPVNSRAANLRRGRNGSIARGGNTREVSEKEVIRRRAQSPVVSSSTSPRRPASVAERRRERPPRGSVVYEYEIVNPGGIHVEYESPRQDQRWQGGRQRSYSRPGRRDED